MGVRLVSRGGCRFAGYLCRGPYSAVEEVGDRGGERVVVVAGNHVTGAGDVRCFGVRDELEEFADGFLGDYV